MELTTDYIKKFDGKWYKDTYYSSLFDSVEEGNLLKFGMDSFHDMFNSDVDFGGRMLDVGTGPVIHSILSASRRLHHIDLSDYSPSNIDLLTDWKTDTSHGDYDALIKYEMKLADDRRSVSERETEIKSKVLGIRRIDLTSENVFQETASHDVLYDVIVSSLCLEAASADKEVYRKCLRNISNLLKTGGYLIIFGVLEETFYRVGDVRFNCLHLTSEDIRTIYEGNGFKILKWSTMFPEDHPPKVEENDFSDFKNVFAMMTQKI
ncbi:hypothetical protein FSP39_022203 [Pinctada imbricata]|uniref:Uncharacterized protein n=1 Tax=Pinctada imbricata TaxID=66713 RepID=A0AA88YMD1_PINIB|nr:hypothetical protein FSP39_022203 [Pinctada imbricata]